MRKKIIITLFLQCCFFYLYFTGSLYCNEAFLPESKKAEIQEYITQRMKAGNIPGMFIVVIKDNIIIYQQGFGYADIKKKKAVTNQTLFELGSTSKAFTALGIIKLVNENKIKLTDMVSTHIPWFKMEYIPESDDPTIDHFYNNSLFRSAIKDRETADISIYNLLTHTSGFSNETIIKIKASKADNALKNMVKEVMHTVLRYQPGKRFSYATINYDILGLIIEEVTGKSFEEYMYSEILNPLALHHTYLSRDHIPGELDIATGYKINFLAPKEYEAPFYRGNVPAGYFITNSDNLSRWITLLLNPADESLKNKLILQQALNHTIYYMYGWNNYSTSNELRFFHGGFNPNYSSFIELHPDSNLGVGVLANFNSSYTRQIGEAVINIISGKGRVPENNVDMFTVVDTVSSIMLIGLIFIIYITIKATIFLYKKQRPCFKKLFWSKLFFVFIFSFIFLCVTLLLIFLPGLIFFNVLEVIWDFVFVWSSITFPLALLLIYIEFILIFIYSFNIIFQERKRSPLF